MIIEEDFHSIEDFQRVCHRHKEIYFLYFYGSWCPPCEKQLAVLKEFEAKYPKMIVYSLNVDRHMLLIDAFQIKGVPYIVAMKDLEALKTFQGFVDLNALESVL